MEIQSGRSGWQSGQNPVPGRTISFLPLEGEDGLKLERGRREGGDGTDSFGLVKSGFLAPVRQGPEASRYFFEQVFFRSC